jgi:hypothetical protein
MKPVIEAIRQALGAPPLSEVFMHQVEKKKWRYYCRLPMQASLRMDQCGMSAEIRSSLINRDVHFSTINSDATVEYVTPSSITNGSTDRNGVLC